MNISELEGHELDEQISLAMGHIGKPEIPYHTSGEIAMRLFLLHGVSIHKFTDGFYATMNHAGNLYMQSAKDPITAIYRAYVQSRLVKSDGNA